MKQIIVAYLPWLLSANTIYFNVLAGNKSKQTWLWALVGQLGWLIFIVASETWGLLPMNIALWVTYIRNNIKWRGSEPEDIVIKKDE